MALGSHSSCCSVLPWLLMADMKRPKCTPLRTLQSGLYSDATSMRALRMSASPWSFTKRRNRALIWRTVRSRLSRRARSGHSSAMLASHGRRASCRAARSLAHVRRGPPLSRCRISSDRNDAAARSAAKSTMGWSLASPYAADGRSTPGGTMSAQVGGGGGGGWRCSIARSHRQPHTKAAASAYTCQ